MEKNFKENISTEEWEKIEKEEHDKEYKNSFPFDREDYKIDPEKVLWWQDYCYKKGRRQDRGHRTKKMLDLMDLKNIKDKNVLDIGCGNGQYSVLFAMLGANVWGFDISSVGIDTAKKIAEANNIQNKCNFCTQSASDMNYEDEKFDIIILHEVLHHLIKYPNVKEEILRVLKKEGKVICTESLEGNIFLSFARKFSMRGQEAKGDIILKLSDIKDFANGFNESQIETMSLLFMAKRIFKNHMNKTFIRFLMFILKITDDAILSIFPFLKRYCGECVVLLKK